MSEIVKPSDNAHLVEFSLKEDKFEEVRKKGPNKWIKAHLLDGSNKIILSIAILTTLISAIFTSATMVVVMPTMSCSGR